MKSGHARLRIKVDGENTIGAERKMLGEMSRSRGFPLPPLKFATAMICKCSEPLRWELPSPRTPIVVEIAAEVEHLFGRIRAPAGWSSGRRRPLPLQGEVSEVARCDAE